jgi:hypothetical protein
MTATQQNRILLIAIPLALIAYLIPWVVNTSTGLTLGAYDLAEWLSLHPATHPARNPSFALRGQLLILTLIITWTTSKPILTYSWWFRCMALTLLVIAQLPPPEFLSWTGDQNQRQQAFLAVISLVGGIFGLTGILQRFRGYLLLLVLFIGIALNIYGLTQIIPRMQEFGLQPQFGIGGFALLAIYAVVFLWLIQIRQKANRVTNERP